MNGDDEAGSGTTNLGQGRRSWVEDKTQIHQNPKETKSKFSVPNKNSTRTIGFGVRRERSVLGGSVLGCDDLVGGAIGAMRV